MGPPEDNRESARSRNMRAIRSKDTKPELIVRRHLHAAGLRFRVDVASLPGSPDLTFPRWNAVIFIHGCFWHRHPGCRFAADPATNPDFWGEKFRRNTVRDKRVQDALQAAGWRVGIVWECALRKPLRSVTLTAIENWIRSRTQSYSSDEDIPPA